ncbi:GerAB/ArcD/ProY family transporter [Caloranaerobacter ferrireducens]|uniref:GerAB/ArcD/ProY family transporter n=1 Tax=Caloranaerobacter ferrireducens TaxID=1323370 RepID=UPI00084DB158|nr:endospore germination permease [Caloranaerobacter ferrireducens]
MSKEVISDKQGISLVIMFIIGTFTILVAGLQAKRDLWLANILAIIIALPLLLIFTRLHQKFWGKDLFDILEICFGKVIGKVIAVLYILFLFILSSLILREFGEFYVVVAAPETPMIVPMIFISFLSIWMLKEGIEVMARWGEFFLPILIVLIVIIIFLLIGDMDVNNMLPIFYDGLKPVLKGALESLIFPFSQTVVFIMIFAKLKRKSSYTKVYFLGLLIGGVIILAVSLTNILVSGVNMISSMYFPTYITATRVNIGDFLKSVEIIIAFIYLLGGFIKLNVCMLAVCIGVSKVFNCSDYRFIVTPILFMLLNLSYLIFNSSIEFHAWVFNVWPYVSILFQIILPIIIFTVASLKVRNRKAENYYDE